MEVEWYMSALWTMGWEIVFTPSVFGPFLAGVLLGVIFGAMPGVSASMAVVLALPSVYRMDSVAAIVFLVAVYCASITGGSITAILYRVPGTSSSAPTALDGYTMAQRGETGKALGISLMASSAGGLAGTFFMIWAAPLFSTAARALNPSEWFGVLLFSMLVLACLDRRNFVKTLISGLLGLFLACVGKDPIGDNVRLAGGNAYLLSGIEMLPVMIGVFAAAEVLKRTEKGNNTSWADLEKPKTKEPIKIILPGFGELFRQWKTWLRSSFLGILVGILPGAGATIASFLSYAIEKRVSKQKHLLGTGISEGIMASEAANNAATGGSMVPLLSLGIPGGNAAAIIMAVMAAQGVFLGPDLMVSHPKYLAGVFGSMVLTNLFMVAAAIFLAKSFARFLLVPYSLSGPVILMTAAAAAYGLHGQFADVVLMAGAGIFGCVFIRLGYNASALILGMLLGPMCEASFRRAYMAEGSFMWIFTNPDTTAILMICVVMLLYPLAKQFVVRRT